MRAFRPAWTLPLLFSAFLTAPASALVTGYLMVREPAGWRCTLQASKWICTSPLSHERDGTLLVSTASDAAAGMTLDALEKQLRSTSEEGVKQKRFPGGTAQPVRRVTIDGQVWIESVQRNLNAPGFTVRHLSTLLPYEGKLVTVIVGYTVSEPMRPRALPQLERTLASIRPVFWSSAKYKPTPGKTKTERCAAGDPVACFMDFQSRAASAPAEEQRGAYGKACAVGCDEACIALSSLLLTLPRSLGADEKHLKASCQRGTPEVCATLGLIAAEKKDVAAAQPLLKKACDLGVGSACRAGFAFVKVEKDKRTWLQSACRAGDGEVCFALARDTKDEKVQAERHRDACQAGYAASCLSLAMGAKGEAIASYLERGTTLLAAECDGGNKGACDQLEKLRGAAPKVQPH